jgi:acetyltransferase-like isoleucine patch superfamily enzyme
VRALWSQLTGKAVDESVAGFPPLYCEFGKNLTTRTCSSTWDAAFRTPAASPSATGALIGHGTTLTTLNHSMDPEQRADMTPAPILMGSNAWLSAGVTVVPGRNHR